MMEDKTTEFLLLIDKALKELYVNFTKYKDAKKVHDLQAKNQIATEYDDYENIKADLNNLKHSYDYLTQKNIMVKNKISKLKTELKKITDDGLD